MDVGNPRDDGAFNSMFDNSITGPRGKILGKSRNHFGSTPTEFLSEAIYFRCPTNWSQSLNFQKPI